MRGLGAYVKKLAASAKRRTASRAAAEAARSIELDEVSGRLYLTCGGVAFFALDEKTTITYAMGVLQRARSVAAQHAERLLGGID